MRPPSNRRYRFLTAGTIEEKVFQRQMSKEGLQSMVCEDKLTVNAQSSDELHDIFNLEDSASTTHDSLKCKRCNGIWGCAEAEGGAKEENMGTWGHHTNLLDIKDKAMVAAAGQDVAFVFTMKYPGQRFEGYKCEDDTDTEPEASSHTTTTAPSTAPSSQAESQ